MASSADVAAYAGVSRSTVSQIFNGHEHRFTPETVELVREAARRLGYRRSIAGRTLARGTSDVVLTLIPDITIGPRLRDLIDAITQELAVHGYTNLLQLASSSESIESAVLGLRPFGLVSLSALTPEQRSRFEARNVRLVEQPNQLQVDVDQTIGALQAEHLAATGYRRVMVAMPVDAREQPYARAREQGVHRWATRHGVEILPTMHMEMDGGGVAAVAERLAPGEFGVAAYNDDVALAVLSAAGHAGRAVPQEIGVIGVDNSLVAHVARPTISTVDIDLDYSARAIAQALLEGPQVMPSDPLGEVQKRLHVIGAESTDRG